MSAIKNIITPILYGTMMLVLSITTCFCQTNEHIVLKKAIIGKQFVFNASIHRKTPGPNQSSVVYDSTNLVYYGMITTNKGKKFKLLGEDLYYGPQPHGKTLILIYTDKDKYIGKYIIDQLPDYLEKDELVFNYVTTDGFPCKHNLLTRVNFHNGLPKTFELGCPGGGIMVSGLIYE